ncbi:TPA: S4 domain-containing protein [Streptococcus suis]
MRLDKFLVDCGVGSRTEVKKVLKNKQVTVNGQVETSPKQQEDVERFAAGMELKDFTCQPAQLTILSTDEAKQTSLVDITIREGKFHQVKRMVQACGKMVTDLQRLSMGPLVLDDSLALGEYRRLTAAELKQLEVFGVEL